MTGVKEEDLPDTAEDGGFAELPDGLKVIETVNNLRVCEWDRNKSVFERWFIVVEPGGKHLEEFAKEKDAMAWARKTKDWAFDIRVIALDETYHYMIDDEDKPFIQAMHGVYMYDKNQRTNCCEITPSYYLYHVEDQVVFTDLGELDDNKRDELDQKYAHGVGNNEHGIYMHCHNVDELENELKDKKFRYHVSGDTGVSLGDVSYDQQIEAQLEYFRGNSVVG